MHWRRKWQPTPVFLPGESQGWGTLEGYRLWVAHGRTWLKQLSSISSKKYMWGFPGGTSDKEPTCQCRRHRDMGSILGLGRCPGRGHGTPLQYSCLENPMDRGVWWSTVHGVAKSQTWLKRLSTPTQEVYILSLAPHRWYLSLNHLRHLGVLQPSPNKDSFLNPTLVRLLKILLCTSLQCLVLTKPCCISLARVSHPPQQITLNLPHGFFIFYHPSRWNQAPQG